MTVGTITSSAEASSSKLYKNVNKTANENSNNYWKKQFLLELSPSVPFLLNNDQPSSLSNGSKPGRYSMSRLSSSVPLFLSWAQLSHSSIHVLRGNNAAPVAINKTIGHTPGNNAMRTSSANGSSELTTGENLPGSPTMPMQRSPGASSIELFDASSPTATTTLSLQSSNKTAAPSTTENILTTSKRPVIIVYPTVSPESIVIPIISCIFGFPLLALLVICCLRRRAKLARERERRRNYDMQDHAVSLVRFSPIHRLSNRSSRAISLRPERSLSRGFPSLELDTVIEERSDQEHTQTDLLSPESPLDPQRFGEFNSS